MKFQSALMTQVSGSVGGATFAHNRGGMYVRGRTIPTDPATTRQLQMRSVMSSTVSRWSAILTDAQRAAWNLFAANMPVTGPLGQEILLSGQQWYVKANSIRILAARFLSVADSALVIDAGPTTFARPSLSLGTIVPDQSDQQISVPYVCDEARTQTGGLILFFQSRPVSPGTSFFRGPWRLAGVEVGDSGTPPTSPFTINPPAFTLITGDPTWIRAVASTPEARPSADQIAGPVAVQA